MRHFVGFHCYVDWLQSIVIKFCYEPAHDKTYNKTCVTSKDSDQPVHPPSMPMVLVYPSFGLTGDRRRHLRSVKTLSDCADAQADLSLCWSHKSYIRFCRAQAHFFYLLFCLFFIFFL